MRKYLLSLVLALLLCVCPAFAVSDSDNFYYSYDSVSADSLRDSRVDSVMSAAVSSTGWTDTDHGWLQDIWHTLTSSRSGTLFYSVDSILSKVNLIWSQLVDIRRDTGYLANINTTGNSILAYLENDLKAPDILASLKQSNDYLSSSEAILSNGLLMDGNYPRLSHISDQLTFAFERFFHYFSSDTDIDSNGNYSLFHYVKNLSETLASEDDKNLAESQKSNREQIEKDFVSGSSGKTSLGASDFADLSGVGGTVKDSISLNGQASVSGFTAGLSDADTAGQGWFSASTRDALDAVTSSDSSLSRAPARDSDPYNMRGFSEHYAWLNGG